MASHLHLLDRGPRRPAVIPVVEVRPDTTGGGTRIRCPKCGWQPRRHDRWMCVCAHVWNTFDTRGLCPACGKQWTETQCRRCHQWSRHEDWYVTSEPNQP
jgi:hypothetical protein